MQLPSAAVGPTSPEVASETFTDKVTVCPTEALFIVIFSIFGAVLSITIVLTGALPIFPAASEVLA